MKYSLKNKNNSWLIVSDGEVLIKISCNKGAWSAYDENGHCLVMIDGSDETKITIKADSALIKKTEEVYKYAPLPAHIIKAEFVISGNAYMVESIAQDEYLGTCDDEKTGISLNKEIDTDVALDDLVIMLTVALWMSKEEEVDII